MCREVPRGGHGGGVVAELREESEGRQWDEVDQSTCVTTCESVTYTHTHSCQHLEMKNRNFHWWW